MTELEIADTKERLRPGARRKKSPMKAAPVMLNDAERSTLDSIAEELGRSRSDLIREAVRRVWMKGKGQSNEFREKNAGMKPSQ